MNNKAVAWRTDEHFTNGKEYECTNAFARMETACVEVLDNEGKPIIVDINDSDFDFVFNNGKR